MIVSSDYLISDFFQKTIINIFLMIEYLKNEK
jgi:hypothetical protein